MFFTILGIVAYIALGLSLAAVLIFSFGIAAFEEESPLGTIAVIGVAILVTALYISAIGWIWPEAFASNNASHCGPGTTYRESSHYDPATKTVQTDWVCERA